MKRSDLLSVAKVVGKVFRGRVAPLQARVAALERQAKSLKYCGVWQRANADTYVRNNAVTHDGSVWIALVDQPKCAPGQGGDWQLAVKGRA